MINKSILYVFYWIFIYPFIISKRSFKASSYFNNKIKLSYLALQKGNEIKKLSFGEFMYVYSSIVDLSQK